MKPYLLVIIFLHLSDPAWSDDWQAIDPISARRSDVPEYVEAPHGGDFILQSANGPVSLADLRGRAVVLYFGYTSCPDICPTALGNLSAALDELDEAILAKVKPIFISVDPKRDDLAKLAEYAAYFHDSITGVTGTEQEVARVGRLYGAKYYEVEMEGSAMGYAVNHSSATYLIDTRGELSFIFPHGAPPQVIAEGIRHVLNMLASQ